MLDGFDWELRERKGWEKEEGNNEDIIGDNWRRENVKWLRIGEMRDDVMFRNEIRRFLGRKNLKLIELNRRDYRFDNYKIYLKIA